MQKSSGGQFPPQEDFLPATCLHNRDIQMGKAGGISETHRPPDRESLDPALFSVLIQKQDIGIGAILPGQGSFERQDGSPTSEGNEVWIVGKLRDR